jgi:hypothetical protein
VDKVANGCSVRGGIFTAECRNVGQASHCGEKNIGKVWLGKVNFAATRGRTCGIENIRAENISSRAADSGLRGRMRLIPDLGTAGIGQG